MHASLKLAAVVCVIAACEEHPKDPPPPSEPTSTTLDPFLFDASAFATDPPAPAGDLKAELEQFVNLDTCVAARAKLDPLVGDALGAIGYDTFLRDACRMLEAAKDKKKETCAQIDSSPLRRRCESWVAIIAQAPDTCPLLFDGIVTRGRLPTCVAVAARDPRLCAGEARSAPRTTCDALVTRDASKCATLLPNQRAGCEREVVRWKNVLSTPLEGLDKLPVVKAKLHLGDADAGPTKDVELTSDVTNGIVVVTARERSRIEMGSFVESEAARFAAGPQRAARLGVALVNDTKPVLQKLELVLPAEAPFVVPPATCECKITGAHIEAKRGSEVSFTIQGKVVSGTRVQPFSAEVTTWVRDVVADSNTVGRVIPALHPYVPGGSRDGG